MRFVKLILLSRLAVSIYTKHRPSTLWFSSKTHVCDGQSWTSVILATEDGGPEANPPSGPFLQECPAKCVVRSIRRQPRWPTSWVVLLFQKQVYNMQFRRLKLWSYVTWELYRPQLNVKSTDVYQYFDENNKFVRDNLNTHRWSYWHQVAQGDTLISL